MLNIKLFFKVEHLNIISFNNVLNILLFFIYYIFRKSAMRYKSIIASFHDYAVCGIFKEPFWNSKIFPEYELIVHKLHWQFILCRNKEKATQFVPPSNSESTQTSKALDNTPVHILT